jgi:hypothetical protein
VLQELRAELSLSDTRQSIRDRMREFSDDGAQLRSPRESADLAWRIVQNVLAEELSQLNEGLPADAHLTETDRLALPDGSQAIDVAYRGLKFSIVRSKDRNEIALIDASAGRLPMERIASKLFIAGEPVASALIAAIVRLIERATAGVQSSPAVKARYMTLEIFTSSAAKVEAALNLANENGFRFVESYKSKSPLKRVFLFERTQ